MRWSALRAHLALADSRWRLVLSAVLAAAAVVVGLITMHSMAGTVAHHEASAAANAPVAAHADAPVQAGSAAAAHPDGSVLIEECDEACQMGCLMVGLMCTLGLVAVLVALVRPLIAVSMTNTRRLTRRVADMVSASLAPPRPPSLTVLSISRT